MDNKNHVFFNVSAKMFYDLSYGFASDFNKMNTL